MILWEEPNTVFAAVKASPLRPHCRGGWGLMCMNAFGNAFRSNALSRRRSELRAFSLIELLVVMTLLSFIVIGLLAVFNQTQRAFKTGMSQVDVLESGRATMDLITRDVEQMTALAGMGYRATNLVIQVPRNSAGNPIYSDLIQELPGTTLERANILQEFFFVSRENQRWIGTGYFVDNGADGIGTLYRFSQDIHIRDMPRALQDGYDLYTTYLNTPLTNLSRVADGVIHFSVRAYGTNGLLLDPFYDRGVFTNITVDYDPGSLSQFMYSFRSDALPSAVEIELAVVEPDLWEQVEALPSVRPDEPIRRKHLYEQAGKVHVFRQRVPIRNFDPDAYKQ